MEDFEPRRLSKLTKRALQRFSLMLDPAWTAMVSCGFLKVSISQSPLLLDELDKQLEDKLTELTFAKWVTDYDSLLALRLFSHPALMKYLAPFTEAVFEALALLEDDGSSITTSADQMQTVMDDVAQIPTEKLAQLLLRVLSQKETADLTQEAVDVMDDLPPSIFE